MPLICRRLVAPSLLLATLLCAAPAAADARSVVPVVTMVSQRGDQPVVLRGATVRVYALGARPSARSGRLPRRVVGRGRTGRQGATIVRLRGARPQRLLVTATGGRSGTRPFRGTLKATVQSDRTLQRSVWLNPASSILATYRMTRLSADWGRATARTRRMLRLPADYDFATSFIGASSFSGQRFLAASHGHVNRTINRLAHRVARNRKPIGFGATATKRRLAAPVAHAAQFGEVITAIAGVAKIISAAVGTSEKIYAWVTDSEQDSDLVDLMDAFETIEADLSTIMSQNASLSGQISSLASDVDEGNYTTAASKGTELVTTYLQPAVADLLAIVQDGQQICAAAGTTVCGQAISMTALCTPTPTPAPTSTSTTPSAPTTTAPASPAQTAPQANPALADDCNDFQTALDEWSDTGGAMYKISDLQVVQNYAQAGGGGVVPGGPLDGAGTIQYAAQAGAPTTTKFYTAQSAELAGEVWAQYVGWTVLGQTMTQLWWASLVNQPNPMTGGATTVDATTLQTEVNALTGAVDGIVQAEPQVPAGAVIDTTTGLMWPQQIGAFANLSTYNDALDETLQLGAATLQGSGGTTLTANVPAGGTVPTLTTLLPLSGHAGIHYANGTVDSVVPKQQTVTYSDWMLPQETQLTGLYGGTLGWASQSTPLTNAQLTPSTPGQTPFSLANSQDNAGGSPDTAGDWLIANAGFNGQLLSGNSSGQGLFVFVNGTYLWIQPCTATGDGYCLMPTWTAGQKATTTDASNLTPYTSPNGQTNLFDLNNALDITNQTGHPQMTSLAQAGTTCSYNATDDYQNWWNNANNWSTTGSEKAKDWPCGVTYPGQDTVPSLSSSLNGTTGATGIDGWNTSEFASLTSAGRPLLLFRTPPTSTCTAYYNTSQTACTAPAPAVG